VEELRKEPWKAEIEVRLGLQDEGDHAMLQSSLEVVWGANTIFDFLTRVGGRFSSNGTALHTALGS
jgi:hypothetical protein